MSAETTLAFQSQNWFTVMGRAVAAVACDRDRDDFSELLGRVLLVDGVPYRCLGVDRRAHAPPWREGEPIGLMLEDVNL